MLKEQVSYLFYSLSLFVSLLSCVDPFRGINIWSSDSCDYSADEFCQVESGDERGEINCRIECREGGSLQPTHIFTSIT
jgi:hypothetical protein